MPRHGEFAEGFKLESNLGRALVEYPYVWFQREERVEIYYAASNTVSRPDGQDANTFRLQLESLADAILHGTPAVNANLEDGIAAVRSMVAIGHSARNGGTWVKVDEVEGDLEHSLLKPSEQVAGRLIASHARIDSQGLGYVRDSLNSSGTRQKN